jgi:hypothetical protein
MPTLFNRVTTETRNQDTGGQSLTATSDKTATDGNDKTHTARHGRESSTGEDGHVCINNHVPIIEQGTPAVIDGADDVAEHANEPLTRSGTAGLAGGAKCETDQQRRGPVCGREGQLRVSMQTSQSEPSDDTGQCSGKQINSTGLLGATETTKASTGQIAVDCLFQGAVKFQHFKEQAKARLVVSDTTPPSGRSATVTTLGDGTVKTIPTGLGHTGLMRTDPPDKQLQLQRIDRQAVDSLTHGDAVGGALQKCPIGGGKVARSVNFVASFNQGGAISDVFEATRNCSNYETVKDSASKQGSNGDAMGTRDAEFALVPCVWGDFKRPLVQTGIG